MKRIIFAAVAATACMAAAIGTPLSAHAAVAEGGAVVLECTADLPHFGSATSQTDGTCGNGLVNAADAGAAATVSPNSAAAGVGSPSVTVSTYDETCAGSAPPALGFSTGSLNGSFSTPAATAGSFSVDYDWTRVGLTAVVLLSNPNGDTSGVVENTVQSATLGLAYADGAAVAAFAPLPPLNVCPTVGDQKALVVAVGASADTDA
jgi:hypothetical protein